MGARPGGSRRRGAGLLAALLAAACAAGAPRAGLPSVPAPQSEFAALLIRGRDWPDCRAGDLLLCVEEARRKSPSGAGLEARIRVKGIPGPAIPRRSLPLGLHLRGPQFDGDAGSALAATPGGPAIVLGHAWVSGFEDRIDIAVEGLPREATGIARMEFDVEVQRVLESEDATGLLEAAGADVELGGLIFSINEEGAVFVSVGEDADPVSPFFQGGGILEHVFLQDGLGRKFREDPTGDGRWGLWMTMVPGESDGDPGVRFPVTVVIRKPTRWEWCLVRFVLEDVPIPPAEESGS